MSGDLCITYSEIIIPGVVPKWMLLFDVQPSSVQTSIINLEKHCYRSVGVECHVEERRGCHVFAIPAEVIQKRGIDDLMQKKPALARQAEHREIRQPDQ